MVGRPFQPGQSGNPAGRPKSKPFKNALQKAINAAGDDDKALTLIADALLAKAQEGDVQAIKEVADRLDGKVTQPISGDDEAPPLQVSMIELVGVRPSNSDS